MIASICSVPLSQISPQENAKREEFRGGSSCNKTHLVALAVIAAIVLVAISPVLKTVIIGGLIIGAALLALSYCDCCCGTTHSHHYDVIHPVPYPVPSPNPPPRGPAGPLPPVGGPLPGGHHPVGYRHGNPPPPPAPRVPGGPPPPPNGNKHPVGWRH